MVCLLLDLLWLTTFSLVSQSVILWHLHNSLKQLFLWNFIDFSFLNESLRRLFWNFSFGCSIIILLIQKCLDGLVIFIYSDLQLRVLFATSEATFEFIGL